MTEEPKSEVAVVLINRNQAWNVARLIESVLREIEPIGSASVIFVDSASSDESVALASRYSIRVLRLRPEQPLTPAAGRYVGFRYSAGSRYVLFLDGDMELYEGWLTRAVAILNDNREIAGVTGAVLDVEAASLPFDKSRERVPADGPPRDVPFAGGAALYRRDVLTEVGPFNPYLHSDEEPELCLRIRRAGYRILQLHWPIAYHYVQSRGAIVTLVGRWRRDLYLGYGQIVRQLLGSDLLWPYLRERGYMAIPALGLAVGTMVLIAGLLTSNWHWFAAWVLAVLMFVAVDAYRKRSISKPVGSLVHRLLIVAGTIRGFFVDAPEPNRYPAVVDVIK